MSAVCGNNDVDKEFVCGEIRSGCVGFSLIIDYISADIELYTVRIFFFWSKICGDAKVG